MACSMHVQTIISLGDAMDVWPLCWIHFGFTLIAICRRAGVVDTVELGTVCLNEVPKVNVWVVALLTRCCKQNNCRHRHTKLVVSLT